MSKVRKSHGWTLAALAATSTLLVACTSGLGPSTVSKASMAPSGARYTTLDGSRPLVIGHRGLAGYMPDHTLEGYARAIAMGADFIEPDVVATKDGELIARHEPNITATTDVAQRPEFASRKTTRNVDGVNETGWFASDFTLAEIKTLRAIQPLPERSKEFNGKFSVPTLKEVLDLAKTEGAKAGRTVGVYIETKHPTYHDKLGLKLEDRILTMLATYGYTEKTSPVFLQSFEVSNLKYLRTKTKVRLVQLIDGDGVSLTGQVTLAPPFDKPYDFAVAGDPRTFASMVTATGLAEIKTYADGVGPWKAYIVASKGVDANGDGKPDDVNGDGMVDERDRTLTPATNVVRDAHAVGLLVHPFTFRSEPRRLTSDYNGDPVAEYLLFYKLGVDGVFSDFTDVAVKARATL